MSAAVVVAIAVKANKKVGAKLMLTHLLICRKKTSADFSDLGVRCNEIWNRIKDKAIKVGPTKKLEV